MRLTKFTATLLLTVASSTLTAHAKDAADISIGVLLKTLANQHWQAEQKGIEDEAAALGVKVTVQAGTDESAIDEQTTMLQTMTGQNYDCLIVAPISTTNLIQPLVGPSNKGIPIVANDQFDMDALKAAGVKLTTFITVRNQDAGRAVAEDMSKRLGGSGKVAFIGGLSGNPSSNDRHDGFVEGSKGLTIVQEQTADWDREKALNATDAILRANPDVGGIYAANDTMALGVQQAVENAGLGGKVLVYGTDAIADAVASVEAGKLTGTAAQFPYLMGQMSVQACVAKIKGAKIEPVTPAPMALITKEDVADAKTAAPKPWFEFKSPFTALLKK